MAAIRSRECRLIVLPYYSDTKTTPLATIEEDPKSYRQRATSHHIKLFRKMKPLLCLMRIFGMFHTISEEELSENVTSKSCMTSLRIGKIWCLVVLLLLWFNVARYFPALWLGESLIIGSTGETLILLVWSLNSTLNATLIFRSCFKNRGLSNFFKEVRAVFGSEDCYDKYGNITRNLAIGLVFGGIFITGFQGYLIKTIFFPSTYLDHVVVNLSVNPFALTLPSKTFFFLLSTFTAYAWVIHIIYFLVMAAIIKDHFQVVTDNFMKLKQQDGNFFPYCMQDFRSKHLAIFKLVKNLDRDFSAVTSVTYICNIPLACFTLYNVVHGSVNLSGSVYIASNAVFLVFTVTNVIAVTLSAASVTTSVSISQIYDLHQKFMHALFEMYNIQLTN